MIEFLQDYTTEATPPEHFTRGQQVERSPGSEGYFVGRGLAGYVVDGKLVDASYRPIVPVTTLVEVIQPGNRRADLAVRAGEVMTGQPPRGSSGPGSLAIDTAVDIVGKPSVVLEAELEQLRGDLAAATAQAEEHRTGSDGKVEQLTAELADAHSKASEAMLARDEATKGRDQAQADLTKLQQQHEQLGTEVTSLRSELEASAARIAELEKHGTRAPAGKPKTT